MADDTVVMPSPDVETPRQLTDSTTWMNLPTPYGPACRDAPADLFFTPEPDDPTELPIRDSRGRLIEYDDEGSRYYPLPEELEFCNRCPVRTECLGYALATDPVGVWGGMSRYQRRQLKRTKTRRSCPGCTSTFIVQEGVHEHCLACGVSWAYLKEAR